MESLEDEIAAIERKLNEEPEGYTDAWAVWQAQFNDPALWSPMLKVEFESRHNVSLEQDEHGQLPCRHSKKKRQHDIVLRHTKLDRPACEKVKQTARPTWLDSPAAPDTTGHAAGDCCADGSVHEPSLPGTGAGRGGFTLVMGGRRQC